MGNAVRNAAEHSSLHALVPDYQKIGPAVGRQLHQDIGWVTLFDPGLAVDPFLT
jgi:hypothetical protein